MNPSAVDADDPHIAVLEPLLEPLLREFVGLIGLRATMALVEVHGGTRLSVAQQASENAALVALIGPENAALLGSHYGGERPFIPKALPALRALRDRSIMADLCEMSVKAVAQKYRLGERRIYQMLAESGTDDGRGPGLFD